jgi:hypothetical protein
MNVRELTATLPYVDLRFFLMLALTVFEASHSSLVSLGMRNRIGWSLGLSYPLLLAKRGAPNGRCVIERQTHSY